MDDDDRFFKVEIQTNSWHVGRVRYRDLFKSVVDKGIKFLLNRYGIADYQMRENSQMILVSRLWCVSNGMMINQDAQIRDFNLDMWIEALHAQLFPRCTMLVQWVDSDDDMKEDLNFIPIDIEDEYDDEIDLKDSDDSVDSSEHQSSVNFQSFSEGYDSSSSVNESISYRKQHLLVTVFTRRALCRFLNKKYPALKQKELAKGLIRNGTVYVESLTLQHLDGTLSSLHFHGTVEKQGVGPGSQISATLSESSVSFLEGAVFTNLISLHEKAKRLRPGQAAMKYHKVLGANLVDNAEVLVANLWSLGTRLAPRAPGTGPEAKGSELYSELSGFLLLLQEQLQKLVETVDLCGRAIIFEILYFRETLDELQLAGVHLDSLLAAHPAVEGALKGFPTFDSQQAASEQQAKMDESAELARLKSRLKGLEMTLGNLQLPETGEQRKEWLKALLQYSFFSVAEMSTFWKEICSDGASVEAAALVAIVKEKIKPELHRAMVANVSKEEPAGSTDAESLLNLIRTSRSMAEVEAAVEELTGLAEKRDVDAQFFLGECFLAGWGVKKNISQAILWLKAAMDGGHKAARERIQGLESEPAAIPEQYLCPLTKSLMRDPVLLTESGHTYEREALLQWVASGKDTDPNTGAKLSTMNFVQNISLKGAIQAYAASARKSKYSAMAPQDLMALLQPDADKAEVNGLAAFLHVEAQNGSPGCQFVLGECFRRGWSVKADLEQAYSWHKLALDAGFNQAIIAINALLNSPGVPPSLVLRAANEGVPEAQFLLSVQLEAGGSHEQKQSAVEWLSKAVQSGHVQATARLAHQHLVGEGTAVSYDESQKLYASAALKGDSRSQWCLGWCHANGVGVKPSSRVAMEWWQVASRNGHAAAANEIRMRTATYLTPRQQQWRIRNVSSQMNMNQPIVSLPFLAHGHEWKLLLFPRGWGNSTHVALFLNLVKPIPEPAGTKLLVHFTVTLVNQIRREASYRKEVYAEYSKGSTVWGTGLHSLIENVFAPGGGFVVNDSLTVESMVAIESVASSRT